MESTLIRQCEETGQPFVAWGRGRPPTKVGQGRAEALVTPSGNIGKYLLRDGTIVDERPEATPAKPKAKAAKAPAKPATAKAVPAAQFVQVPPPPPHRDEQGKTLVQALADGDLHPDTFLDPPGAEDSYDSLYGEGGISPDALDRPEPDEYMHSLLADGTLRGYSVA